MLASSWNVKSAFATPGQINPNLTLQHAFLRSQSKHRKADKFLNEPVLPGHGPHWGASASPSSCCSAGDSLAAEPLLARSQWWNCPPARAKAGCPRIFGCGGGDRWAYTCLWCICLKEFGRYLGLQCFGAPALSLSPSVCDGCCQGFVSTETHKGFG